MAVEAVPGSVSSQHEGGQLHFQPQVISKVALTLEQQRAMEGYCKEREGRWQAFL